MHCAAVVMCSFLRKSRVSAAAAAADGHAGWKHDSLDCPFTGCLFTRCLFTGCLRTACLFTDCLFTDCLFAGCLFPRCLFTGCLFPDCLFIDSRVHVPQLSVCMMVACCTGSGQPMSESELSPTSSFESVVLGRRSAVISLASCVHFREKVLTLLL